MKTRQGFVSNSSSSSFIFLGVMVSELKFPEGFDIYKSDYKPLESKYLNAEGGYVIGKRLATFSDDDYKTNCISVNEIHRLRNMIITALNDVAPENENYPVRLFYGGEC